MKNVAARYPQLQIPSHSHRRFLELLSKTKAGRWALSAIATLAYCRVLGKRNSSGKKTGQSCPQQFFSCTRPSTRAMPAFAYGLPQGDRAFQMTQQQFTDFRAASATYVVSQRDRDRASLEFFVASWKCFPIMRQGHTLMAQPRQAQRFGAFLLGCPA